MDILQYESRIDSLQKKRDKIAKSISGKNEEITNLNREIEMLRENINYYVDKSVVNKMIGKTYKVQKEGDREVCYITVETAERCTGTFGVYWTLYGSGYFINRYGTTTLTKFEHTNPRDHSLEYVLFDYARGRNDFAEIDSEQVIKELSEWFSNTISE